MSAATWPQEQQPDGAVTPVDPADMSPAQRAAAHDVSALAFEAWYDAQPEVIAASATAALTTHEPREAR